MSSDISSDEWEVITGTLPADGRIVETKIHDVKGPRNESLLVRRGNLWYFADESMYVYYAPTHYRKPLASDLANELCRLSTKAEDIEAIRNRILETETR